MRAIDVNRVGKSFGADSGMVRALHDVTFATKPGEFVSIVGPSGCGKTTLLRMIGDLLPTEEGSILVGGVPPREARKLGLFSWVFQSPVLLPWRTVLENVRLPLEIRNPRSDGNVRSPEALIRLVGLESFTGKLPKQLSGGMQQRVALARALTFSPDVLLMDEPFAALDELTRGTLNVELLRICAQVKTTVLFVTHSISEAVYLSDSIVVFSPRPGTVKAVIEVPFARPRNSDMRHSDEFREIVECVESKLH